MSQPMVGPQQPTFPGPTGFLVLQLARPWGSMGMITPQAQIDGYPVGVQWGRNEIVVPAGVRQVAVSCTYLWQYGHAQDAVPVGPGQQVEVHYSPPLFTFIGGRIGPVPQPRAGRTGLIVLLAVLGLAVILAILGSVLSVVAS
jgi:hypothetical protein